MVGKIRAVVVVPAEEDESILTSHVHQAPVRTRRRLQAARTSRPAVVSERVGPDVPEVARAVKPTDQQRHIHDRIVGNLRI